MAQKQILESIRDLISGGGDDDVLDLTEVLEEGKPAAKEAEPKVEVKPIDLFSKDLSEEEPLELADAVEIPKAEAKAEPAPASQLKAAEESTNKKDVLSEIDALLAADEEPEKPAPVVAEPEVTAPEPEPQPQPQAIEPKPEPKPEPRQEPVQKPQALPEQNITQGEQKMSNEEQLISSESAQNAQAALKTLSEVVQKASSPKIDSISFRNGDTVEDLVTTMMKPILKEWLDLNLPKLVQSIVEKEIKKLLPKE